MFPSSNKPVITSSKTIFRSLEIGLYSKSLIIINRIINR